MLIDDVIQQMENFESRNKANLDVSDVIRDDIYCGAPSFLSGLSETSIEGLTWERTNEFRVKIVFIQEEIARLIMIVRRLRDATKLPFIKWQNTKTLKYAEIDAEFFFHLSYSILTVLTGLTEFFYRPSPKYFVFDSFERQRRFFIDPVFKTNKKIVDFEYRKSIDPKYSEYLMKETSWFVNFIEYRSSITHFYPPIIAPRDYGLNFMIKNTNKEGFSSVKIPQYVNETTSKLLEFIDFYDEHFSKTFSK